MDVAFLLIRQLAREDGDDTFLEGMMEFAPCPVCEEGRLLPFSEEKKPFSFWVCCAPSCGYTIGRNAAGVTYYKGTAAAQEKEKGLKKWQQFDF